MRLNWNAKHVKAASVTVASLALVSVMAVCAVVIPDYNGRGTESVKAGMDLSSGVTSLMANIDGEVVTALDEITRDEVEKETVVASKEKASTVKTAKKAYNGAYLNKFMVNLDSTYLNVRAKASKNAEVVGKLYVGSGGKVLKMGKKWTQISSGNVKGYVSTKYLLFDEAAEKKAKEVGTVIVTINADSLRVRKEPTTQSGIYGTVANGEKYTGLGEKNGFIEISFEGKDGYISKEFVTTKLTVGKAISIEEELEAIRLEQERIAKEAEEAERKAREEAEAIAKAAAQSKFVETVQGSAYNISEEDAYLIACVVSAEAGYESYEGQLAVANIVLNRLASGRYGSSVREILYASGQFTVVSTPKFQNLMANGPMQTSIAATKAAVSGTNNIPGFTSYCASWAADYSRYNEYTIVGNQTFYR